MKTLIYLLVGIGLMSFAGHQSDDLMKGIWKGYYRSELIKEKVIVKFNNESKIEFYTGGVDERTMLPGIYQLEGDSVSFSYVTNEGEEFFMKGHVNDRRNFLDGTWITSDSSTGSFYLEKQTVQENYVMP